MARLPRLAFAGRPHYLVQRGHNGAPVFLDAADRAAYLAILREAAATHRVAIHAYALGDTEIRLLATPDEAPALSQWMQAVGRRYVAGFNRRHGRSGTLWSGRFRSTVVEDAQVMDCVRHIEASAESTESDGGAPEAGASSAPHHAGVRTDPAIKEHAAYWRLGNTPFDREAAYRRLQETPLPERVTRAIADAVQQGWPLGSAEFKGELSKHTARRLHPLTKGRPRKSAVD
jgi:putative transposase